MEFKYLVCVECCTFNHGAFVEDAMNGFTIQQTNFPYVCVIMDDFSKDDTANRIKAYLSSNFDVGDKTVARSEESDDYIFYFARHKQNFSCYFAVFFLKYNHHSLNKSKEPYISDYIKESKYCAICEGDDYWISSNKLQKQFDYMEEHAECTMTFHNAIKHYIQQNKISLFNNLRENHTLTAHEAIADWLVPTASIMFRSDYYAYPEWLARIYSADYALILRCLHGGEVYGFANMMSVYRVNTVGTSASASIKGKYGFVESQHKILLESFNRGTEHKYDDEVSKRILFLDKEIEFQKLRTEKSIKIIFKALFYKKIYFRLLTSIKEMIERTLS